MAYSEAEKRRVRRLNLQRLGLKKRYYGEYYDATPTPFKDGGNDGTGPYPVVEAAPFHKSIVPTISQTFYNPGDVERQIHKSLGAGASLIAELSGPILYRQEQPINHPGIYINNRHRPYHMPYQDSGPLDINKKPIEPLPGVMPPLAYSSIKQIQDSQQKTAPTSTGPAAEGAEGGDAAPLSE